MTEEIKVHVCRPQKGRYVKEHVPIVPVDIFEDKECWVYDLEVYPNYFLLAAINSNGEYIELIFDEPHDSSQLGAIRDFINDKSKILIGFNNLEFDDFLLKYIYSEDDNVITPTRVYNFSVALIKLPQKGNKPDWYWKYWGYNFPVPWHRSIDVYQLRKAPGLSGSLKEQAAKIRWHKLQDLPIAPGTELTEDQKRETALYCRNDVEITCALWNKSKEAVFSRLKLEEMYPKIDVISKYNSAVCEEFFKVVYSERVGISQKELKSARAPKYPLEVKKMYPDYIEFGWWELRDLLDSWDSIVGDHDHVKKSLQNEVRLGDITLSVGAGGLHSKDTPFILESNEDFDLIEVDAESFYPAIAINRGLRPRQLGEEFCHLYKEIRDLRLDAKKNGRKVESDGLKITINSAFGKTGNRYSVLYDPFMQLSITVTGQLALLLLIEMFIGSGIPVVSANTDGVVCKAWRDPHYQELFETVIKKWENTTGFVLEKTYYRKYVRRDVNNYMTIKPDGKIKTKGVFDKHKDFAPVVIQAIRNYYQFKVPVQSSIYATKEFSGFCYYFQAKQGFELYHNELPVQKTARWYVTDSPMGEGLKKVKGDRTIKIPNAENSTLVNDFPAFFPDDLDYSHYIQKALDVLETIEGRGNLAISDEESDE